MERLAEESRLVVNSSGPSLSEAEMGSNIDSSVCRLGGLGFNHSVFVSGNSYSTSYRLRRLN